MGPDLDAVFVADAPSVWTALGFAVDDDGDVVHVSGVRFVLGAEGKGLRDWTFRSLSSSVPPAAHNSTMNAHPNGVVAVDHVVITTPDLDRTIAEFETRGHDLRRVRDTGTAERPMRQAFFKAGAVVLEVVGPRDATGDGPSALWGLTWTVGDLDVTAAFLGTRLRPSKTAVQPGRRIATLDRAAGSSVPMAFMSR